MHYSYGPLYLLQTGSKYILILFAVMGPTAELKLSRLINSEIFTLVVQNTSSGGANGGGGNFARIYI